MHTQPDLWIAPVSFLRACDINLACSPIILSPISPSISPFGTNAATESITIISIAFDRINCSVISSACSPLSGCDISKFSVSIPSFSAYVLSNACSASINAAMPPFFCASAIQCIDNVVLPDDSGPYISTTLPCGSPPIPKAMSRLRDPVGILGILTIFSSLNFIMVP